MISLSQQPISYLLCIEDSQISRLFHCIQHDDCLSYQQKSKVQSQQYLMPAGVQNCCFLLGEDFQIQGHKQQLAFQEGLPIFSLGHYYARNEQQLRGDLRLLFELFEEIDLLDCFFRFYEHYCFAHYDDCYCFHHDLCYHSPFQVHHESMIALFFHDCRFLLNDVRYFFPLFLNFVHVLWNFLDCRVSLLQSQQSQEYHSPVSLLFHRVRGETQMSYLLNFCGMPKPDDNRVDHFHLHRFHSWQGQEGQEQPNRFFEPYLFKNYCLFLIKFSCIVHIKFM